MSKIERQTPSAVRLGVKITAITVGNMSCRLGCITLEDDLSVGT